MVARRSRYLATLRSCVVARPIGPVTKPAGDVRLLLDRDPAEIVSDHQDSSVLYDSIDVANEIDRSNRCDGKRELNFETQQDLAVAFEDYYANNEDLFIDFWDSDDGIFQISTAGHVEEIEAALTEIGVIDYVCVSENADLVDRGELDEIRNALVSIIEEWSTTDDAITWESSLDLQGSRVVMYLPQADAELMSEIENTFGSSVLVEPSIEVLNGSMADYDAAVSQIGQSSNDGNGQSADITGITAGCGPAQFPTIPPDVNGLPPIDADAQAILDDALTSDAAVELEGFIASDLELSIATRTDSIMVLFGRQPDGEGGQTYSYYEFENGDGWRISGWGGCNISVSAVGLDPADVILDPAQEPDPASHELAVLIRERNCANGQAPVGREIVPVVTETDNDIEIVVLVAPVPEGATCPGNPWHPITITLDRPFGSRNVLDASHQTPTETRMDTNASRP